MAANLLIARAAFAAAVKMYQAGPLSCDKVLALWPAKVLEHLEA